MSDGGVTEVGTMRGYVWTPERRRTVIGALALIFVLAVSQSAYAAKPTRPVLKDAYPSGGDQVTLKWETSVDADGHGLTYEIYRSKVPITSAMITPTMSPLVSIVAPTSLASAEPTWTAIVDADVLNGEVADAYVWYYAVRAKDDQATPVYSDVSATLAPNLHGYNMSANVYSCQRCHNVHGAPTPPGIVDRSSWICYYCHGRADNNASSPIGDKSTVHTKADFYDYGNLPSGGSRHRSTKMTTINQQCRACHSPHRAPYYFTSPDGTTVVYDPLQSFRKMLRVQTGVDGAGKPTYTNGYYSRNDDTAENTSFCFSCHGSTTASPADGSAETNMGYVSDGGYAATAGDHNEAGYATAAHGTAAIKSNDFVRANASDYPQVQCLACHAKHASAADKLIAYRGSDTKDGTTTYAQAELCYACHSAAGYTAETAAGTATGNTNFAWNGRDVKAQFGKASKHPTTLTSGTPTPTEHATFSHTTQAEFATYGLLNTMVTASGDGEITLYRPVNDPDPEPIVFGQRGSNTTFDQYTPRTNAWNDLYNPTNNTLWSPGTGSSAFVVNGQLYMTRGGGNNTQGSYNPATNTWAAVTNVADSVSTGGDSAVNTRDGLAYYLRADGSSRVMWWQYGGTNTGQFDFRTGGTNRSLGIGAALAYAPTADRMFIIWGNNGSGDGRLYWRASPGTSTTSVDFTQGAQVIRNATGVYSRMTYFTRNGTEYLFVIGQDTSSNNDSMLIHTIDGTPVVRELNNSGPFNAALADGCDLEWDGGDYLYAIRGGSNAGFARIQIPSDPVSGTWGSWQSLTSPPWGTTWPIGSSIAVGIHDEPASYGDYATSGTATSVEILPYADAYNWGTVSWTENQPAGTSFTVTVQGWDGSAWQSLVSNQDISPIDLTTYGTGSITKLRLIGSFSTSSVSASAELRDWAVTSVYDRIVVNSGSLTCANCHNVHSVGTGGTEVWDMARVSDPDNTKLAFTGTPTQFCLRCHDGAAPTAVTNETSLVPYSVGFSEFDAATAPLFPGWNKQATGTDWASSGHANSRVNRMTPGCESCHDPHGSNNPRLLAGTAYYVGTSPPDSHVTLRRNDASTYAEEGLCYVCHTSQRATPTCTGGSCHPNIDTIGVGMNVQTAFSGTYRHPVEITGKHSDTEGPAELGQANRHAECVDCHDPHATRAGLHTQANSKAGEVLRGAIGIKPVDGVWPANWTAIPVEGWASERISGEDTDYEAYVCLKCHGSYSGQPFDLTAAQGNGRAYTSTDVAMEFNPSNQSEHNVFGQRTVMETAFTVGGANYTWAKPTDTAFLRTGWTSNSEMTCTDCHSNNTAGAAKGPHGSSTPWMIADGYTTWTNTSTFTTTTLICFKCHTNLANSNNVHSEHATRGSSGGYCRFCHVKIPHGWKRPRLIGYTTDPEPYATIPNGINSIILKSYTPNNWQEAECGAACSSSRHPVQANPWP